MSRAEPDRAIAAESAMKKENPVIFLVPDTHLLKELANHIVIDRVFNATGHDRFAY